MNNLQIMKEKVHPDVHLPNFRANVTMESLINDVCSGVENLSLVKKVDSVNLDNLGSSSDEEAITMKKVKRKLDLVEEEEDGDDDKPITSKKKKKKKEKK